ncbi:hemolysin family protein [Curtobacterium sp. C1]|uniref:HlyC/CorC family transporter n=1 Tax=Curtobacterium citreum TaxID=2036 RepID=A0A850DX59_9MICO|nr:MULTISPECIES: hemolysin family protein [Curtobacterium]MCS5488704.1 hemolysin family protein [Curtobacterium flaccumfaciens pv. basellae]MDK8172501.1 hemolysin family protein [Curtobacterium citreum]NUU28760.1 HlyC/CorC family transporter [Curtobacterium albidum]QKS16637.1 HlyC/CorC family transporter [Curtobacterium sp. Csp2]RDH96506.1 CBS domain containing-hemolysin-like protein [Curtobacterium sp. AG1037]
MVLVAVLLAVAFVLVVVGGLLAASDAALTVLSRADLDEIAKDSSRRRAIEAIADDVGAHVNALNFVRVLAETAAAVLVTIALVTVFDTWWVALIVSAAIMTAVSFVLVGSSPRSVGRAHAERFIAATGGLVRGVRIVLGPLAGLLVAIGDRVTPGRGRSASTVSSEEQLLSLVDEATESNVLEQDDRELIHSVFEFSDTLVREVMVPRTDMLTVDGDDTLAAGMEQFLVAGVSRMPVTGKDSDDVLGVLYLRDVSRALYERQGAGQEPVTTLLRPAEFVPESKHADDTLRHMQLAKNHLVLVVDEYGGVAGLVTMEDLIEELVGDISDEYDRTVVDRTEVEPGVWRIAARLPIDELGDLFGIELEDDDVDTAGGLLTKELGRLPVSGEQVSVSGLLLTADRVEGKRRHLVTVLAERTAALQDAEDALDDTTPTTTGTTNA